MAQLPPRPDSAWMWKPRSKTTDDGTGAGSGGGLLGSATAMFGSLRNNVGASSWNKRYVGIDGSCIYYGKSISQREKTIPLETVRGALACTRAEMKSQSCPEACSDYGWKLIVVGKDIVLGCEDEVTRNSWVTYIDRLVATLSGGTALSATSLAGNTNHHHHTTLPDGIADDDGGVADDDHQQAAYYGTTTSQMIARQQDIERERATQMSFKGGAADGGMDDDDDNVSLSPIAHNAKSQSELKKLTGNDDNDEDDLDFDNILAGEDDDEGDDEISDDEDGLLDDADDNGSAGGGGGKGEKDASAGSIPRQPLVSRDDAYQKFLLPIAKVPYSHIQYKIAGYSSHFDKDDSAANIIFSREVDKIAKRDNVHKRDLVLTTKNIYMFSKGKLFTGVQVRTVPLDQLVGVVESTIESNLIALICPAFHDILIRITPQNSLIPGNEVQVKHQLIAHLYSAHRKLNTGRQFLFREVENVRSVIRRDETQDHLPLQTCANDKLRCASNPALFPVFRINADSSIAWSSIVTRLNAERSPAKKGLVIADSAFYIVSDDLKRVQRRTSLSEITRILFDVDLQGLLIKCTDVDALLTIKDASEFAAIRQSLVDCCAAVGQRVKCVPSRQLFSHASLVESKKLKEMFGDNAEGLKKGMKFTQRLLMRSWKASIKSMDFVTNSVAKVGEVGVDLLRQAGKEVGGVLVDNQLTGELLGVLNATTMGVLSSQVQRVVFETIIRPQDEAELLQSAEPYIDQLKLGSAASMAEHKMGKICYSSRCGLFNLTATIDHHKTENRFLVVSESGVALFHPLDAAFSLLSPIRGIVDKLSKGLKLDARIDWSAITGMVRCSQEDNVIGIQTNQQRHTDVMVRLPNAQMMSKFIATCALLFSRNAGSRKYLRVMMNLYSAPRTESVRAVMKKTTFNDAAPSIALRAVQTTNDALGLRVIPDVVDTLRRYGDNTMFFSGIAWRLRGASTKKSAAAVGKILNDDDRKGDNKLFKSFLLILTNCAVYDVTKGGYEIHRRVELSEITGVVVTANDPNAMVITIPQFNMYFRIEGRGQEFLDRLQEARATWTPSSFRPTPTQPKFAYPLTQVPDLAAVGGLEKPASFKDEENKYASDILKAYHMWHKKELVAVTEKLKQALDLASKGIVFEPEHIEGGASAASSSAPPTFSMLLAGLENAVTLVEMVQERAFVFGIRAATSPEMAAAQKILLEWYDAVHVAEDLQRAIEEEDIDRFEERFEDLNNYPAFAVLVTEQSHVFEMLRSKKEALSRIVEMIQDSRSPLVSRVKDLEQAFLDAEAAHVKPSAIAALRQRADVKHQQESLISCVQQMSDEGQISALSNRSKHLLRDAAVKLDIDRRLLEECFGTGAARSGSVLADVGTESEKMFDRPRLKSAVAAIAKATELGNVKLLTDTINRAKALLAAAEAERSSLRAGTLAAFEELGEAVSTAVAELAVYDKHEDLLERQVANVKRDISDKLVRNRNRTIPEMQAFVTSCETTLQTLESIRTALTSDTKLRSVKLLDSTRAWVEYQQKKVKEKLAMAKEELRIGSKEAEALADAREHVRRKEEEEKARLEEEQLQREEAAHNRRVEFLNLWMQRCQKLTVSAKTAITNGDTAMVKQCIRNCAVFQNEVQLGFAALYPTTNASATTTSTGSSVTDRYQTILDDINSRLSQTAKLGQAFIDEMEPVVPDDEADLDDGNALRDLQQGPASGAAGGAAVAIPDELVSLMQHGSSKDIVRCLQSLHGTLNRRTMAEVRTLWVKTREKRLWVAKLHKALHTAFSLKNASLLAEQIAIAKEASYVDDHVRGAIEILKNLRSEEEAEEKKKQQSTASPLRAAASESVEGGDDFSPEPKGAPAAQQVTPSVIARVVRPLQSNWSGSPKGSLGEAVVSLHSALTALAKLPSNTLSSSSTSTTDPLICPGSEELAEVKDVVTAWLNVLQHRAKPSGLFRKVERSVQDVLTCIGNVSRSGDVLAPYTNRLCSDFERIKKFNQPRGQSSSYVLVSFLLVRRHLTLILNELERLSPKDLGDIFYEDSVCRNPAARLELRVLAEMTDAFEWPFVIHEKSAVATSVSIARSVEMAMESSKGPSASFSAASSDALSVEKRREESAMKSIAMLRLAVRGLSAYFASQLKTLSKANHESGGDGDSAAKTHQQDHSSILDEKHHKEVGLVVRDQICPALMSVLNSGYRSSHLLSVRRLWDLMHAVGERLRERSRALNTAGIPDAIDMVESITDRNGRNKTVLHRLSEDQLSDVRVRMLLCHCMNQRLLMPLFESIFDDSNLNAEFLKKFFAVERCMMFPATSEAAVSVMSIVKLLSSLPFGLTVDAEIW